MSTSISTWSGRISSWVHRLAQHREVGLGCADQERVGELVGHDRDRAGEVAPGGFPESGGCGTAPPVSMSGRASSSPSVPPESPVAPVNSPPRPNSRFTVAATSDARAWRSRITKSRTFAAWAPPAGCAAAGAAAGLGGPMRKKAGVLGELEAVGSSPAPPAGSRASRG